MLNVSKKLSKDCEKICFQECSKIAQSGRTFLEGTIVTSVTRLGNFLHFDNNSKPVAIIILPKLPTLIGNFCKGAKIIHFSSEIKFGQLL